VVARLALFELEEYKDAKEAFQGGKAALALDAGEQAAKRFQTWIRKCDAELDSMKAFSEYLHGGDGADAGLSGQATMRRRWRSRTSRCR
jgi:hypothetical protein